MGREQSTQIWVFTSEYGSSMKGGLGTVATELSRSLNRIDVSTKIWSKATGAAIWHTIEQSGRAGLPDAIHIHSLEFASLAIRLKKRFRIPLIYTCHSLVAMEHGSRRQSRIHRQQMLIRHADRVIVPSLWLKNQLTRRLPGQRAKTFVIPNGVNSVSNHSAQSPDRLLFVGRIIRDKGIEPLIHAVSNLSRSRRRIHLTVIGKGSRHYLMRLKALARNKGVNNKIRWRGFIPHQQMLKQYGSYGAVVIPSKQESFGLVALEAMASGVPVVSTRAGGLKEFVSPHNAQIIQAVSPRAVTIALRNTLNNPQLRKRRVANGRSTARRYRWSRIAARYKQVIMRLISSQRKNGR